MRQECGKFGEIKKITIHDRNADGVIVVVYKEFEDADACVAALNNRWFGGRRIAVTNWDGKEKFVIKETPEQEAERLRKWDEYLESGGENSKTDETNTENASNKSDNSSTEAAITTESPMETKDL